MKRLTGLFNYISIFTLVAVVLIIVIDVFMRFILGSTLRGAYEMVQYVLMLSIFSSFAYCQTERGHVHVTMLISLFPKKLRFILYALTTLLAGAGSFAVAYSAIKQGSVYLASNMTSGVLLMPLFPFYWVEGICMAVFGLALLWEVVKSTLAIWNPTIAEEIQSSWT